MWAVALCQFTFLFKVCRFDSQQICAGNYLVQRPGATDVTDKTELRTLLRFTQDLLRLNGAPVRQDDRPPRHQLSPLGPGRYAQGLGLRVVERRPRLLLERKAVAAAAAMGHGKGREGKSLPLKQRSRLDHVQTDARLRNVANTKNDLHQTVDPGERGPAGVYVQLLQRLPVTECAGQPSESKNVVEVTVGEKNLVQSTKTKPAAQNLALRAFAAVDKEAVFLHHHHCGGQAAVNRRSRSRGTQKDQFKQGIVSRLEDSGGKWSRTLLTTGLSRRGRSGFPARSSDDWRSRISPNSGCRSGPSALPD